MILTYEFSETGRKVKRGDSATLILWSPIHQQIYLVWYKEFVARGRLSQPRCGLLENDSSKAVMAMLNTALRGEAKIRTAEDSYLQNIEIWP